MGDLPNPAFNGKTPLQVAKKPNIDRLASEGICGLLHSVGGGRVPGSDTSHLALFGYPPDRYYTGRGTFEALGAGLNLERGDVAFRCNFATVEKEGEKLVVKDRRAGRIGDEDAKQLAKVIDGLEIDGVKVIFKHTVEHRAALVLRGKGLSWKVSDVDPHDAVGVPILTAKPLDETPEAKKTAAVLNALALKSYELLSKHKINVERAKKGELQANIVLPRGPGIYENVQSVQERFGIRAACIAGGALYKGVAKYVGMDVHEVDGATGKVNTDVMAKGRAALAALKEGYDYVFIHVKGTDNCGHDGKFEEKVKMIEKIDGMIGLLLENAGKDVYIALTADHTTSCIKKRHSSEPTPFALWGPGVRVDDVKKFDEFECAKGGLGHLQGIDVMPMFVDLMDKAHVYGS